MQLVGTLLDRPGLEVGQQADRLHPEELSTIGAIVPIFVFVLNMFFVFPLDIYVYYYIVYSYLSKMCMYICDSTRRNFPP